MTTQPTDEPRTRLTKQLKEARLEPFDAVTAYRKHPESLKKLKRYCDRKLAEEAAEKPRAA